MNTKFFLSALSLFILAVIISGCSSTENPVIQNNTSGVSETPVMQISEAGMSRSGLGVLGAYSVTVDLETMHVELTPLRSLSIGESFIVNGLPFFSRFPCENCFQLAAIQGNADQVALGFYVSHPFDEGDPGSPPSGMNRLDLDIFDLAAVFYPQFLTGVNYPLMDTNVALDFCLNPDGYTRELSQSLEFDNDAALPYFLVVDESTSDTPTYNEFPMGTSLVEFETYFKPSDSFNTFYIFLTMAYGASATFETRLAPKYYNPEFNRKAAWKVYAEAHGIWYDLIDDIPVDVDVLVWDWQSGATVYSDPEDFQNAPIDNIYAASEILEVAVEIPGMTDTLQTATIPNSGTGQPNDPFVFTIPIKNENFLGAGYYTGLVRVTDSRAVQPVPPDGSRDHLVSTEDGKNLDFIEMPEYATYQTFPVEVGLV